jgi:hypothetical protein
MKYIFLLLSAFIFSSINSLAQDDSARMILLYNLGIRIFHVDDIKVPQEVDVPNLFWKMFPGLFANHEKSVKRSKSLFHFSVFPAVGYTLQTNFAAVLAFNTSINEPYLSKNNLTNISTSFAYTLKNQFIMPLLANIWTKDEKFNIILDWRFLIYPQSTYGLGSFSSLENEDKLVYSYLKFYNCFLRKITSDFYIGSGYNIDYHWDITEHAPTLHSTGDFDKYGKTNQSVASGPAFDAVYDNRRNSINPQGGFYGRINYCYHFKWLGSDNNWQSLQIEFRKYLRFPESSNNILAFWNFDWFTPSGKPSYLDLPSTGWDPEANMGRGYIQGRYRGLNLLYFESEYRFPITPNHLLGAVIFSNIQSVSEWPSNQFKAIRPGVGTGIRIKLNKYSNTNLALDYGFGVGGSNGIFVSLGEVF